METQTIEMRQLHGCGFLPRHERACPSIAGSLGYTGPDPTVCPGFSTNLPEVIEVARASLHWAKGGPAALGITDWQDSPLMMGVEILEGARNDLQDWKIKNPEKGGA